MTDALLEVEGLNGYYGTAHVLQDVAFSMGAEPVALIGRNGMGKSTMCAAIVGLLERMDGSVRLDGVELMGKPAYRIAKAGVGYVPQGRRLFTSLTVDEHLEIVGARKDAAWTPDRVYELFPRLAERRGAMGNQLSGGEQQMLAIGRALMGNPSLLLMDEPLEGLAPIIVEALLKAMARLIREEALTVILVEQSAKLALEVTERALVLNRGRIVYDGPSAHLLADKALLTSLVVAQ